MNRFRQFRYLGLALASALSSPLLHAQLQIVSPAANTPFAPGDMVTVTVSITSGSNITQVFVLAPDPIPPSNVVAAAPYTFQMVLPNTTPIGAYNLIAVGNSGPGTGLQAVSNPVTIFVDKNIAPTSLSLTPSNLALDYIGDTGKIFVIGTFADGTTPMLNRSPQLSFASGTPAIASVDASGNVTAVAAGTTTITASYRGITATANVTVTAGPTPINCTYSVQALQSSFTADGGSSSVNVTPSDPSCSWTAAPGATWLVATPPAFGIGNGTVSFSVETNTSAARNTSLLIAGQILSISQAGSTCSYSVSNPTTPVYGTGGVGSVSVTTASTCAWTASSDSNWLTIIAGANGTGNGAVAYSIAANSGPDARTANLTVAGQTFPISETSATCTYSVGFATTNPPAAGGSGAATVTAPPGCAWSVTSDSSWFTITSGATGTGNGSFNFTVAANPNTTSRTANVTVGTQTVAITQDGVSCSFQLGGAGITATAAGGTGTIGVGASASACTWGAVSNSSWLTVTSGANGTGSGTVGYTVAANPDTATRIGTLTIAGLTFTVTQTGVTGSVTLSPAQVKVPAPGGSGSISVTANAPDFAWTASSNSSWLTITSGASGAGSGTVAWSAPANSASTRTATITVAGQNVTFTQLSTNGGPYAFVTNVWQGTNDSVGVVDTSAGTIVGLAPTISGTPAYCQATGYGVDYCYFTHAVTVTPDGTQGWAANTFGQNITVVDTTASVVATIPVSGSPRGVAFLPDGSKAYAVNQTGQVTVINTSTYSVDHIIDLTKVLPYSTYPQGSGPYVMNIVISQDGKRAYMTDVGGFLVVMDLATEQLTARIPTFLPPNPYSTAQWTALSPDGTRAFITDSGTRQAVLTIDTGLNQILGVVPLGGTPRGIAVTADGAKLYVANDTGGYVSVVDVASQTLLKNIPLNGPRGVTLTPDGNVWATAGGSDYISDPGAVVEIDTTLDQVVKTVNFTNYCCMVQIDAQHPPVLNRLSNSIVSAPGAGGNCTITIETASSSFSWTATTTASWLTINSPDTGTGAGSISCTAQPNYGEAPRETQVQIGTLVAIVVQPPAPYTISTLAGGSVPSSVPAGSFTPFITSLAVSPGGDLFVGAIPGTVYDLSAGAAVRYAGTGVEGPAGDEGPAANAQVGEPWGLAFDAAGDLYIADSTNNSIRRVDASSKNIVTIAGGHGWNYSGDGGPAILAQFSNLRGLAVDNSGNIYVGDVSNFRVRKIDALTGNVSTVAGNGAQSTLGTITGLAVDAAANLYIADVDHNRIWKVTPAGVKTSFAGTGYSGYTPDGAVAANSAISQPMSVAVDSQGNVYLNEGNRVRMVAVGTGLLSTVAGTGNFSDAGDGGSALAADLDSAMTLAVDAKGDVYIGQGNDTRVRKVSASNGIITTILGTNTVPEGIPASDALLSYPQAVAVDDGGNVFYADTFQHRVRRVDAVTGVVTSVAGIGGAGYVPVGLGASSPLAFPSAVALDAAGNLYIADAASIQLLDTNTGILTTLAGGNGGGFSGDNGPAAAAQLSYGLSGLAVDGNGSLFVADMGNARIRKINLATSIITTVAGNGTLGFSGDNGPATAAEFNSIIGIGADAAGNLFVCDNGRVRRVDAKTGIIATISGSTWGDSGDDGPAAAAQFQVPTGCAVDDSGDVFVGDRNMDRVRKISGETGYIREVAGISGIPGISGDGGPGFSATLDAPIAIAVQRNGNLYVADSGSGRVRALGAPATPCTYTLSQTSAAIPAAGGSNSVSLATSPGCSWTTTSNSSWISITSPTSGTGSANITYTASSSATLRYGSLTIAGQRFSLTQSGGALKITKSHTGNFTQGQTGATYTIIVSNAAGAGPTTGTVTVIDALPVGLTLVSMAGTGWTCQSGRLVCQRSDVLAGQSSYPPITVTVNVAGNAAASVINQVSVSGGGSGGTSASDSTTIVSRTAPMVTVTPAASSITTTQALQVTVTVNSGTGNPTPTGTVTLSGGGYTSSVTTLSSGSATITVPPGSLSLGSETLSATYTPDANSASIYLSAMGSSSSVTVSKAMPMLTVTPAASSITTTQALQVTVTVNSGTGNPTPTGTVTLANGTYSSSSQPLTNGAAGITIPAESLIAGNETLSVSYSGDSIYSAATGTVSVTVTLSAALVTITPANNGVFDSSQAELVTVTVAGAGPVPTGTVTLSGGNYTSASTMLSSGTSSITIPGNQFTTGGNITLTANYSGDTVYASGSGAGAITVNPPYSLSTTTPSAINPGGNASATITLAADPSYSGSVTFTCALATSPTGAQDLPTCSVTSGSTVTVTNGAATGSATVTFDTTGATSGSLQERVLPGWESASGGMMLALLLFLRIPGLRRNKSNLLLLALTMAVLSTLVACGGGGSVGGGGGGGGGGGTPGTTAGNYTFTITGTANPGFTPAPTVAVKLTVN